MNKHYSYLGQHCAFEQYEKFRSGGTGGRGGGEVRQGAVHDGIHFLMGFYLYSLTNKRNSEETRRAVEPLQGMALDLQRYCTLRDGVWMWLSVLLRTQDACSQGQRRLPSPAQPTTTLGRCVSELELCGVAAEQSSSVAGCLVPEQSSAIEALVVIGLGWSVVEDPGTNGTSTLAL